MTVLQQYIDVCTVAVMSTIRMPISTASRKGVSGVVGAAEDQPVLLTSHGRAVARVEGSRQAEESARMLREARLAVLDAAGDLAHSRARQFSLDEVCARLGLDPDRVRALADERMRSSR